MTRRMSWMKGGGWSLVKQVGFQKVPPKCPQGHELTKRKSVVKSGPSSDVCRECNQRPDGAAMHCCLDCNFYLCTDCFTAKSSEVPPTDDATSKVAPVPVPAGKDREKRLPGPPATEPAIKSPW
jgi:hypothetical protein